MGELGTGWAALRGEVQGSILEGSGLQVRRQSERLTQVRRRQRRAFCTHLLEKCPPAMSLCLPWLSAPPWTPEGQEQAASNFPGALCAPLVQPSRSFSRSTRESVNCCPAGSALGWHSRPPPLLFHHLHLGFLSCPCTQLWLSCLHSWSGKRDRPFLPSPRAGLWVSLAPPGLVDRLRGQFPADPAGTLHGQVQVSAQARVGAAPGRCTHHSENLPAAWTEQGSSWTVAAFSPPDGPPGPHCPHSSLLSILTPSKGPP